MPMLCRSTLLLMAAAAILAGASPAHAQNTLEAVRQKGVLVAGSSAEYPPFEYVADGKLVGYDVDTGARRADCLLRPLFRCRHWCDHAAIEHDCEGGRPDGPQGRRTARQLRGALRARNRRFESRSAPDL